MQQVFESNISLFYIMNSMDGEKHYIVNCWYAHTFTLVDGVFYNTT